MSASDPMGTFREEVGELLDRLESALIRLEETLDDPELIDEAFRSLHTIKGSGGMLGLHELVSFTHTVEAAFALVRDGHEQISESLIELGLQAKDQIADIMASPELDDETRSEGDRILAQLRAVYPALESARPPHTGTSEATAGSPSIKPIGSADIGRADGDHAGTARGETTFRIQFAPKPRLFRVGANPILLLKELRELGETVIIGLMDRLPVLDELDPEACYLRWDILLTTEADENAVRDVFIFVEGEAEIFIEEIDSENLEESDIDYKRIGEILVSRGLVTPEEVQQAVNEKQYLGDVLVEKGLLTNEQIDAALQEQQYVRRRRETRQRAAAESQQSIKVDTEKLDALVNLVGEFVAEHATLSRISADLGDGRLTSVSERLEALIREVRDVAMDLHMVPVEMLFSTYRRLIRDLSRELGKEVHLELDGTDTEMDKNVIERLRDPMLHIIRNSLDHGIEQPEERVRAGKPREGTLRVAASYSGAHVLIRVSDDGAGINREAVWHKAVERGLLTGDEELEPHEIYDLICAPGFSTTETATNVSGRGVGLDVVRSSIEGLSGSIHIDSEEGSGTTINIRIPLTLAIVEGLLVRVSDQHYLVNLANVLECIDYSTVARHSSDRQLIEYRGSLLPFFDLGAYFSTDCGATGDTSEKQLVVVSSDGRTVGLLVDEVYDTFQSVIKSLGKMYENVPGVSGAVILGDGRLALMLDVDRLTRTESTNSP